MKLTVNKVLLTYVYVRKQFRAMKYMSAGINNNLYD